MKKRPKKFQRRTIEPGQVLDEREQSEKPRKYGQGGYGSGRGPQKMTDR